jgi:hypothetical protein
MQTKSNNAKAQQGWANSTLSHETATSHTFFRKDTLTPEEALLAITGMDGTIPYNLCGEDIKELKELTVQAVFHYTSIMESEGLIDEHLYPLQLMYQLLLNIENIINTKNLQK